VAGEPASSAKLGAIAFDCSDPTALATFYSKLLDVPMGYTSENFATFKAAGIWISFHRVADYHPPRWPDPEAPQQLHVDLAVTDIGAAAERAVGLGGHIADEQPAPDRWRVMVDPAGHPFCLSPASAFPE